VAINKSYYFIVGADAMGCKIKKRKADPPFSKAYPHQRLQRNLYLLLLFFFKSYLWVIENNDQIGQQ
jgi:hypothetical protein